jgi:two-component system, LuxR family, response regulator FixJ
MDALSPWPRLKVFVVDDDEAVRDSIKVLLEVHGIDVEDYKSADEFARHYRRPRRGCLILDQNLPVLTGVDFLNSPAGRRLNLPVILITGRGDAELERRARAAGAAEFLQKPVSQRLLIATIERVTAGQDCRAR